MPHFGLMDEKALGKVKAPLQRARLHIRGGKRRLREGKTAAGIVTLYDSLQAAMEFYARSHSLGLSEKDLNDEKRLHSALVESKALDGDFDFEAFDQLTVKALHQEINGYNYRPLVEGLESVMTRLGVMPFDESTLPPEDPNTF